jgi:hypothetical protein
MSVMPSILARSLRTEAAQPPQTMFGTLRETSTPSAAVATAGGVVSGATVSATGATTGVGATSTDTGSDSPAQPAKDAMTPAAISIGTNFFTVILQKNYNTNLVVSHHRSGVYLNSDAPHQPDTLPTRFGVGSVLGRDGRSIVAEIVVRLG